jgi:DNA-directed RNA polymerase specialized sigma24 family protein
MSLRAKSHLERAAERMVDERFPEGLLRTLEGRFPAATYADCEDAVSAGFEQLVRRADRAMENPRGYVTTVAVNAMKRLLRRAAIQQLADVYPDEDVEDADSDPLDAYTSEWDDPVVAKAMLDNAHEFMQSLIASWPVASHKATMQLVLAAAMLGEPLSSEELAQRLADVLGEEVQPATARQWRSRAIKRLKRELIDADLIEDTEDK